MAQKIGAKNWREKMGMGKTTYIVSASFHYGNGLFGKLS
jgi:hypothetical protein